MVSDSAPAPASVPVAVSLVHFRSGGMLADVVSDLLAQEGVNLDLHVVESGSDGTVERLEASAPGLLTVHRPGRNVGYAGGNNIAISAIRDVDYVLVINPDVRMLDRHTLRRMIDRLGRDPGAAALAPVIVEDGVIEYADSMVDTRRAVAIHTRTHVTDWPWPESSVRVSWLDGACLLFRRRALTDVGGFDERYFLIVEEVDWCLRATSAGWSLVLDSDCEIEHQRSSSFGTSVKASYYHARNTYLLFKTHGDGRAWRLHWVRSQVRTAARRSHLRSGQTRAQALGVWHALLNRTGAAPEDRNGNL